MYQVVHCLRLYQYVRSAEHKNRNIQKYFLSSDRIHSFTRHERYRLRIDKCLVVRACVVHLLSPQCHFTVSLTTGSTALFRNSQRYSSCGGSGASRWVVGALLTGLFFRGAQKSPLGLRTFFVFSDIHTKKRDIIQTHSFHEHVTCFIAP